MIEKREAAEAALMEASQFKTRTTEALRNLRKARGDVVIAERRLWASIESIEDGFAVFDRDRRIISANGRSCCRSPISIASISGSAIPN